MKRITRESPTEVLESINVGDFVTDGFSKTGIVASVELEDDGFCKIYHFLLVTDRVITIKVE
jgi:hypothetical protein